MYVSPQAPTRMDIGHVRNIPPTCNVSIAMRLLWDDIFLLYHYKTTPKKPNVWPILVIFLDDIYSVKRTLKWKY